MVAGEHGLWCLRMTSFKFLNQNEIRWVSFGGLSHPISSMSTNYIRRLMIAYGLLDLSLFPPQSDNRTTDQWYEILKEELKRRNETI